MPRPRQLQRASLAQASPAPLPQLQRRQRRRLAGRWWGRRLLPAAPSLMPAASESAARWGCPRPGSCCPPAAARPRQRPPPSPPRRSAAQSPPAAPGGARRAGARWPACSAGTGGVRPERWTFGAGMRQLLHAKRDACETIPWQPHTPTNLIPSGLTCAPAGRPGCAARQTPADGTRSAAWRPTTPPLSRKAAAAGACGTWAGACSMAG